MINSKGFAQMGRKWQRLAALGRRRSPLERRVPQGTTDQCTTQLAQKGHFVVYTIDGNRFEIPVDYLNNGIIELLFKLSEEEFGYSPGAPITLTCDGVFMEYVMDLMRRQMSEEVERAIVNLFILPCHQYCSLPSKIGAFSQQLRVC
jgi:Auxin responsive protein